MKFKLAKTLITLITLGCSSFMFFNGTFSYKISEDIQTEKQQSLELIHPSSPMDNSQETISFKSDTSNETNTISTRTPKQISEAAEIVTTIEEIPQNIITTMPSNQSTEISETSVNTDNLKSDQYEETETLTTENLTEPISSSIQYKISKDNLFVCGDSISSGFAVYNKLPTDHVMYKVGIPSFSMFQNKHNCNEGYVAIKDYIEENQPSYLLMMYGTNDLGYSGKKNDFASTYIDMAEEILTISPNTQILINAIPPLASSYAPSSLAVEYNNMLKDEIAARDNPNISFIDTHSLFTNNAGDLDSKYDGGDGIHLKSAAYDTLLDYIISE